MQNQNILQPTARNLLGISSAHIKYSNESRDVSKLNLIAVDHYGHPKKYTQKCFL